MDRKLWIPSFFLITLIVFSFANNLIMSSITSGYKLNYHDNNKQKKDFFNPKDSFEYSSGLFPISSLNINFGSVNDFVIKDSLMYCANLENGLVIYNISNLEDIKTVGICSDFTAHYINIQNSFVYIIDIYYGLYVCDVSNASHPIIISNTPLQNPDEFVIQNSLAVIELDEQRLAIYNISIPYAPRCQAQINPSFSIYDIKLYNEYLYVATTTSKLVIYDISNIEIPLKRNEFSIQGLYAFDIKNNILYALSYVDYLVIYDISDIYNPLEIAELSMYQGLKELIIQDNFLYVLLEEYIWKIDITTPSDPNSYPLINFSFVTTKMGIENNLLVVKSNFYRLYFFNLTSEDLPLLESYQTGGYSHQFYLKNSTLFIANGYEGLKILNISNISNPKIIGNYTEKEYKITKVSYSHPYCIVSNQVGRFKILNVSNLTNPQLLSSFIHMPVTNLIIRDNFVYTIENSYFSIYNITSDYNLELVDDIYLDVPRQMTIRDNYAFITSEYTDLFILDISNPSNIQKYSYSLYYTIYPNDLCVKDDLIFIASSYRGVLILNISQPTSPEIINDFLDYKEFKLVSAFEDKLLVGDFSNKLWMYNISIPTIPSEIGEYYNAKNPVTNLQINGNISLVTERRGKLKILGEDNDYDSLANYWEEQIGTNKTLFDTDEDLLPDGYEITYNLNPLDDTDALTDFDNDSLSNYEEYDILTNPKVVDTDGDLLSDGDEFLSSETDPTLLDSDGDSLGDGFELLVLNSNPLAIDSDGDQLPDIYEYNHGWDPSDNLDGQSDKDQDGLKNVDEYILQTDPNNPDSDFDGYSDGDEVKYGTNPLDPNDFPSTSPSPTNGGGISPILIIFFSGFCFIMLHIITKVKNTQSKRLNNKSL